MSHPYPEPDRLGPDRLLAAWSARELLGGGPAVVIDAGTAITVDLVDGAGGFAGGAIAPGVAALARALGAAGRMLVEVEIAPPIHYPGRCREEALAAGIAETIAGGVQRLVGRALACEPGAPLIITGGDAGRIAGLVPELDLRHEPGLIARGLALLECRG